MKICKYLIIFVAFFVPFNIFAQLQTEFALPYLVQEPKIKSANPPMLILMHGYASNETDLFELKDNLPQNFIIIALRAPTRLVNSSYQWFGMETINGNIQGNRKDIANSVAKVKEMIPELTKKYHADATQVYLSGFSQGGMMCYEVGLTAPELLKGIAPLSGKIFEQLKQQIKITPALKKLSIFIGHGDADTRLAYSFATEANEYLQHLKLRPESHTYKGIGHSINQQEITDLVNWLSKK